ncbi:50S ribosomal protein L6 [Chloroflexota bacterium]
MSRIGRMPIPIPKGIEVNIAGSDVKVKGPKGELARSLHPDMQITMADDNVVVERPSDGKDHRALHGLTRSLVNNMVLGVSEGFKKTLEMVGVGYRAQMDGVNVVLQAGYSHPVNIVPMPGITLALEGNNKIIVTGINKEDVGQQAANIRKVRKPNPYTGKGIKYEGERIRRKAGKAGRIGAK